MLKRGCAGTRRRHGEPRAGGERGAGAPRKGGAVRAARAWGGAPALQSRRSPHGGGRHPALLCPRLETGTGTSEAGVANNTGRCGSWKSALPSMGYRVCRLVKNSLVEVKTC